MVRLYVGACQATVDFEGIFCHSHANHHKAALVRINASHVNTVALQSSGCVMLAGKIMRDSRHASRHSLGRPIVSSHAAVLSLVIVRLPGSPSSFPSSHPYRLAGLPTIGTRSTIYPLAMCSALQVDTLSPPGKQPSFCTSVDAPSRKQR